jgi:hypothetical protein
VLSYETLERDTPACFTLKDCAQISCDFEQAFTRPAGRPPAFGIGHGTPLDVAHGFEHQ